jgi:hypothetical protein
MTGAKTQNGLNVRILLPHVVYLNQKQSLPREDVAINAFVFDSVQKKARVQLENRGPNLGRVHQMTVANQRSTSQPSGGFPLLPRRRRWAEVEWDGTTPPTRLVLKFSRYTIDTVLIPVPASLATDPSAGTPRP